MIGVFDSGIGGLTILDEIVNLLPNYDFIYYGDSKNNPYGEKSDDELLKITSDIVDGFIKRGCRIVVIACNTATTRCMRYLRFKYPNIVFIGTVPAIKVACDNDSKNTLVMATPATIDSERTMELIRDNKRENQNIYLVPCYGLAHAIEYGETDKIIEILSKIKEDYKDVFIDTIVLGCTHYPYIKDEIKTFFPNSDIVDGSLGVAKEVYRQVQALGLKAEDFDGNVTILNSNNGDVL